MVSGAGAWFGFWAQAAPPDRELVELVLDDAGQRAADRPQRNPIGPLRVAHPIQSYRN